MNEDRLGFTRLNSMSFLSNLANRLPIGKKEEEKEYFFALNIGAEKLTAALWLIERNELKILEKATEKYSSDDEISLVTDKLLDQVLGEREIEPQKILFGVPHSWLSDDNLKEEYLKLLRNLVKELELTPMAYVATSHALIHFLEKQESIPTTAILVGFNEHHLTVTVVRAGKLDGVKIIQRGDNSGSDIEKGLLTFTEIETLPSKILIYGEGVSELKTQLLSYSWMSKLSFLHFPKVEVLNQDLEIKSICLAGGSELNKNVKFVESQINQTQTKSSLASEPREEIKEPEETGKVSEEEEDFGFVVGDVAKGKSDDEVVNESETESLAEEEFLPEEGNRMVEVEDFEQEIAPKAEQHFPLHTEHKRRLNLKKFMPKGIFAVSLVIGVVGILALFLGTYLFFLKADVKVFVEPRIQEEDAQVIADPAQKTIDEDKKIIPGQVVDGEVSGSGKDSASGKRQIGDPAKGTVIVYNKTSDSVSLSKGTQVSKDGVKFTLDSSVSIASQSASDSGITFGKEKVNVTAVSIGADGNLPSGAEFTVAGYVSDKMAGKSEGNFSGGTSKNVTVVSSDDQQRLLAKLTSDLRQQAQQKLQDKYPNKKILQEALSEQIISKSYSKNVNDQANEFSLNMTIRYKGTAFEDKDLKAIVSKLVNTKVPEGFTLDISQTETQADVSKLEKDGKLIFLAKFKAKLIPKIDTEKIKKQIIFKTPDEVVNIIKSMENVLGAEVYLNIKQLPSFLQRLPILSKNINVEVGLK